jgi:hypothetical protein
VDSWWCARKVAKLLVPYMGYIDDQLKALTHLCVLYFRFWLIS